MPTPISLPDVPIGGVVSGDVVLRNVVVNVPSTRFSKPDTTSPAMPLDGRPYNPSLPQLPQKQAPATQFSKDLKFVDPATMPADSFSVLIDNVNGVVIKANAEETNMFIQEGAFYLGSFDSATADLVIKDMIENPIPTEEELIARAFDANMHLYLTAYVTGAIMFSQYKNAKENWGNYVPADQVAVDKILTPDIIVPSKTITNFPKTAVIKVFCLDNSQVLVSYEGVRIRKCLVDALQVFRQYAGLYDGTIGKYVEKEWKNQPPNWSWKMLPESAGFQLIYHPTVQNKNPQHVLSNSTQDISLWNYVIRLNELQNSYIFTLETESLAPLSFSPVTALPTKPDLQLPNVPPQIADKVEQYVAINEELAKLVETGQDVVIDNVTPLTNQELVDLTNEGLATVENVVNPNASNKAGEGEQLLYEYIEINNLAQGTWTSTWKPIGKMKDFDCTKRGRETTRDGMTLDFCILPNGRKGYILKQGSVPTIIPSSNIIKATINPSPQYQQLATIRDQIGQQLGVPAGCTPQNPTVLPPSAVPSNCAPINRKVIPTPIREPQTNPVIQPLPPTNGGGGGTVADQDKIGEGLGVQGGGFIILPRPNLQGGQAVHYPSGKQFTIVSDGKGGAKIGSYIAGTGLNA